MTRPSSTSGDTLLPQRRFLAAVLGDDLAGPERLARAQVEGVQDSGGALGEDASVGDGGRGPRPQARDDRVVARPVGVAPPRLAGGEVVGHHQLLVLPLLLGDGEAVHDHERGPGGADGLPPDQPRRPRRPVAGQAQAGHGGVAVRSQELRPGRLRAAAEAVRERRRRPAVGAQAARVREAATSRRGRAPHPPRAPRLRGLPARVRRPWAGAAAGVWPSAKSRIGQEVAADSADPVEAAEEGDAPEHGPDDPEAQAAGQPGEEGQPDEEEEPGRQAAHQRAQHPILADRVRDQPGEAEPEEVQSEDRCGGPEAGRSLHANRG